MPAAESWSSRRGSKSRGLTVWRMGDDVAVRLPGLVAASRRFSASLSDRSRVRTVGNSGGGEPRVLCHSPHLLYIWHCATGANQPSIGLGVPDQDVSQGPSCRWANWWRSILTFSPLISPYTFKTLQLDVTLFTFSLVALLLASSHCRSVRRACLIMTVISYRQT